MKAFLIEGLDEVVRGLGATIKLFWPVAAVYVVMAAAGIAFGENFIESDAPDTGLFLLYGGALTVAGLYVFLALSQGAVAWHRRIVLKEDADWISPLPRARSLRYAGAAFLFTLVFLIGNLIPQAFILIFFTPTLGQIDPGGTSAERLENLQRAMLPFQMISLAGSAVVALAILWLCRSWLLVFPHISVRSTEPAFAAVRQTLIYPTGLVGALLLVYLLPSLLGLIYYVSTPVSVQISPTPQIVTTVVGIVLAFFCFLWGLSILSLAYRRARAGNARGMNLNQSAGH